MGSIYAQKGSSSKGGSVYAQKGGTPSKGRAAPKPKHKGGGGVLGAVGRGLGDLENAAVNSPAGVYTAGRALAHDVGHTPQNIYRDIRHPNTHHADNSHTAALAFVAAHQTKADLTHPLRHPGYSLLDALAVASLAGGAAARIGEAGRAGSAGEAAKALVRAPKPQARVLDFNGEKVGAGYYSKNQFAKSLQKGRDRLQQAHPEMRFGPKLANRVGKELHQNDRVMQAVESAPAHQLLAAAKGLKAPQRLAIRVVAEGVPVEERIAHAEKMLTEATGRTAKLLRAHISLLKKSQAYVHNVEGVPRIKPSEERLVHVYEKAKSVAGKREQKLTEAGLVGKKAAEARKDFVGKHLGFNPDHTPELFHNREGFYVTYAKTPKSVYKPAQIGNSKTVGFAKRPGSLKEITGKALDTGDINPDTPRVVAESHLEANRYLGVLRKRDQLIRFAKDEKVNDNYIPIRPGFLKNKPFPPEVKDAIDNVKAAKPDDIAARQKAVQKLQEFIFPSESEAVSVKGIKWVDKRLLGESNLPRPLVGIGQYPKAQAVLRVNDSINNATRLALLYLKPAYAVPNILGNVALNLIQQGVFAPKNIAYAARLNAKLGREDAATVDALMGEGVTRSILSPDDVGLGHRASEFAAGKWSKFVDTGFRRSSFIHEARRAGFKTPKQINRLLHDEALRDKLTLVTRQANEAIIDYGRLSKTEQDLIRRIVFLYPWVKGSTRFAGKFLRDNPVQADIASKLAAEAQAQTEKDLGDMPSYAAGFFKVGQRGQNPLVSNPAAAAIFQTPQQIVEALKETAGGNVRAAYRPAGMLSPTLAAALTALSGKDAFSGYNYPPSTSPAKIFAEQLYGGTPQYALERRLTHKPSAKSLYPYSSKDALMQFILGSLAPRPVNTRVLHEKAKAERMGR